MAALDARILAAVTRRGRRLMTMAEVKEEGATERQAQLRVERNLWHSPHAGVYLIGALPMTWEEEVLAGTLAGDPYAIASELSALRLRGLGDFGGPRVQITVPNCTEVVAQGVKVRRSRRDLPWTEVRGIRCTTVEQTLLDVAAVLPARVLHQIFTTAWRRRMTTPKKVLRHLEEYGGRGVKGTGRLRGVVEVYEGRPRPPGSEAEADFFWDILAAAEAAGVEPPVLQFRLDLGRGNVFTIDFAWPDRRKLVEVMGAVAHGDYVRQAAAYERAALIRAHRWELHEEAPKSLADNREATIRRIIAFVQAPSLFPPDDPAF